MKSKWIHIILLVVMPVFAFAQEPDIDKIIEAILESQSANAEEDADVALIIEDLEDLSEHPLNINATDAYQLSRLYLLNSIQISDLLNYIKEFGPAYSLSELAVLDGFTPELLQKMQPFIVFGPKEEKQPGLKELLYHNRQELLTRGLGTLQKARGYKTIDDTGAPYEGNRFRYYSRYRVEAADRISAGITAEKDPGEAMFKGSNKQGFDYYSGHLNLKVNKTLEQLTLGDFVIRAGQGLVLWQGYAPVKSSDVISIMKYGQGVRPYTSVDENLYFRGAAATLHAGKGRLAFFYSQKRSDANLDSDENNTDIFTSLQTSGYHRTESEIADEKSVKYRNMGSLFVLRLDHLKIGATLIYNQFDRPFQPGDELYNRFRFKGSENITGGVDYLFSKGKYQFFGEAALSKSKGTAFLQGAVVNLNDRLSLAALYRQYDKNYHALWGQAFAEGSSVSNENGLYLGAKFLPARKVTLSVYSDFYRLPWIAYATAGPSQGWDVFAQADFVISEKMSFYVRYKTEVKDQKFKGTQLYTDREETTQKLRLHTEINPSESWRLMTRLEFSGFTADSSEYGFLIYQDVNYAPQASPFKISARLAYFTTASYDSRIYAYENDLLYTFSVPAFYGKGFRTYLNLRYNIGKHLDFWLKIANTYWADRETISSGYNEIDGHNKTELKLQLRLKF